MRFQRTLTPDELLVLGPDPKATINTVINDHISKRRRWSGTTPARLVALMSTTDPMSTMDMTDAFNAVYGADAISFNYVRSLISNLLRDRMIIRVAHGKYLRGVAQ